MVETTANDGARNRAITVVGWISRSTKIYPLVAVTGALIACLLTPGFLTPYNIKSVLTAASITGIAAIGLTAVTVSGNLFSLSTGGTATVAAITYALLINHGALAAVALLVGLAVSALIG